MTFARRPVRLPNHYAWFVLLSSLDIMLTWAILSMGGCELNLLADRAQRLAGLWGLIGVKFSTVCVVVWACEGLAQRHPARARRLAVLVIAISAVPVIVALGQLALIPA